MPHPSFLIRLEALTAISKKQNNAVGPRYSLIHYLRLRSPLEYTKIKNFCGCFIFFQFSIHVLQKLSKVWTMKATFSESFTNKQKFQIVIINISQDAFQSINKLI